MYGFTINNDEGTDSETLWPLKWRGRLSMKMNLMHVMC